MPIFLIIQVNQHEFLTQVRYLLAPLLALGKIFGHDAARLGICKLWSTAEDLGNAVGRNVLRLRKDHPTKGWMRGDEITKEQLLTEKSLRARIDELERRLREAGG